MCLIVFGAGVFIIFSDSSSFQGHRSKVTFIIGLKIASPGDVSTLRCPCFRSDLNIEVASVHLSIIHLSGFILPTWFPNKAWWGFHEIL